MLAKNSLRKNPFTLYCQIGSDQLYQTEIIHFRKKLDNANNADKA